MKDKIIELSNNNSYYVLEELIDDGKKYIFASQYNEQDESIDENNFTVVRINFLDGDLKIIDIEDELEAERISKKFIEKMKSEKKEV